MYVLPAPPRSTQRVMPFMWNLYAKHFPIQLSPRARARYCEHVPVALVSPVKSGRGVVFVSEWSLADWPGRPARVARRH
jgi:hypothetical protein